MFATAIRFGHLENEASSYEAHFDGLNGPRQLDAPGEGEERESGRREGAVRFLDVPRQRSRFTTGPSCHLLAKMPPV